jgi:hypothetical protein
MTYIPQSHHSPPHASTTRHDLSSSVSSLIPHRSTTQPPGQPRAAFGERSISKEASDVGKAKLVWELSEKLIDRASKALAGRR